MGQINVLQFLKDNRSCWFTAVKIAKELNIGKSTIYTNMMRLKKRDCVMIRDGQLEGNSNYRSVTEYKYKR